MRSEHADLGARERGAREGASGVKATDAAMSERKTTERIVPSLEQVRGDARFVTDVDHSGTALDPGGCPCGSALGRQKEGGGTRWKGRDSDRVEIRA